MMIITEYKYHLDPGSRKFSCPSCQKKRFVRYIESDTGQYLDSDIGRCDRANNCGYHKPPSESGFLNRPLYHRPERSDQPIPSTLPGSMVEATEGKYEANKLISWLATLPGWDTDRAISVARQYKVGTGSGSVNGWSIFWQIDRAGKVRSGHLMKYSDDGRRVKEGYSQNWTHSILKKSGRLDEFELVQCFYGLHLIDGFRPVAIVESEKTAIICSQYLPMFTWLASVAADGINEFKMRELAGRQITLFPDKGCFEKWSRKAAEFGHIADIRVSDLLERKAPEQHTGYDLADYLTGFNLADFIKSGVGGKSGAKTKHLIFSEIGRDGYPADWDEIGPPEPGSIEYVEMIRAESNEMGISHSRQIRNEAETAQGVGGHINALILPGIVSRYAKQSII